MAGVDEARDGWIHLLTAVELARMRAYRRPDDQARFLVGCTLIRTLTSRLLGIPADRVSLDRTCSDCGAPHGRVRVVEPEANLEVSVSHSGDWVLVALSSCPVGVDVEGLNSALDTRTLAPLALSLTERARFSTIPPKLRPAAFITVWCRKEAALKATGDGLRRGLTHVTVADPREPAELISWSARPDLVGRLRLHDIEVDSRHRACVAYICSHRLEVQVRHANHLLAAVTTLE